MSKPGRKEAPRDARGLARVVLERVLREGAWATLALDAEATSSMLPDRDRRLATELVYGVLRHKTLLEHALASHADLQKTPPPVRLAMVVAAYQLLFLDRVPAYAAVNDAVTAARTFGGPRVAGFVNAVLRKVAAAGLPVIEGETRAALALRESMPTWIVDEFAQALTGELGRAPSTAELGEALAACNRPPAVCLRVNRRRATRAAVQAELQAQGVEAEPHHLSPDALICRKLGDPASHEGFQAGRFTVQDVGAQRVALVASPAAQGHVLDACAGVGGKATHLAELQDDTGRIDAADLSSTKLGLLTETAARLGVASIAPMRVDLTAPSEALAASYQLVVLDAPCSGLGVLRRHPDAKWRLAPTIVAEMASLQARMLAQLATRVGVGGALVYSVCSVAEAEGPAQVRALLAARPEFRVVTEERTWPHRDQADGFYLARLERMA